MTPAELKEFLDEKVILYNRPDFISSDPIQIPHLFSRKEDIEIAGFLAATIAWGNRKMIIANAKKMVSLMGDSPYDFVMGHKEHHLELLEPLIISEVPFSTFGLSSVPSICRRVVLPAPDAPTIETISPFFICRSTPLST